MASEELDDLVLQVLREYRAGLQEATRRAVRRAGARLVPLLQEAYDLEVLDMHDIGDDLKPRLRLVLTQAAEAIGADGTVLLEKIAGDSHEEVRNTATEALRRVKRH